MYMYVLVNIHNNHTNFPWIRQHQNNFNFQFDHPKTTVILKTEEVFKVVQVGVNGFQESAIWLYQSNTCGLLRTGRRGGRGYGGGGKREIIYLSLHGHHQNDSCIKMGNDEGHFNVSLIVRDKVTRRCPQTTTFLVRKESRSRIELRLLTSLMPYR